MWQKLNNLYLGLAVGVILPAILYFVFVHPRMNYLSALDGYYHKIILTMLPLFLTRCIFPNALIFFLLVWQNMLDAAKGILISTAVLTGSLVILNFVL